MLVIETDLPLEGVIAKEIYSFPVIAFVNVACV
jgi:hypothetical protein